MYLVVFQWSHRTYIFQAFIHPLILLGSFRRRSLNVKSNMSAKSVISFVGLVCVFASVSGPIFATSLECDHVLKTYEELGCSAVQSSGVNICNAR